MKMIKAVLPGFSESTRRTFAEYSFCTPGQSAGVLVDEHSPSTPERTMFKDVRRSSATPCQRPGVLVGSARTPGTLPGVRSPNIRRTFTEYFRVFHIYVGNDEDSPSTLHVNPGVPDERRTFGEYTRVCSDESFSAQIAVMIHIYHNRY